MVEYAFSLDNIFGSLADPTRRDILRRVTASELSVSEIAKDYQVSLAAISKHVKILEKAKLIIRRRQGKQYFIQASPTALKTADEYLQQFERLWDERFDRLERLIR